MSVTAVIPAAGVGKRFGGETKKQFHLFNGKPALWYTLTMLKRSYSFDRFIIGGSEDDFETIEQNAAEAGIDNLLVVKGGEERSDTVLNCVIEADSKYVLVHDAVRPFVPLEVVNKTIEQAMQTGACICGVPLRDTLKVLGRDGIQGTVDRNRFMLSHTPQVFEQGMLIAALMDAKRSRTPVTDEAQAVEMAGRKVQWVESVPENIKITYSSDVDYVNFLVEKYFS
ncbi:2-C-methyl-D-erythritol 4-phosphate cytidylyltransferase [Limisalsivibrio acetivorans]|uniref:2-C-methyl-D-erythritol 4-phosphate cytidylyltransferase n=1 Tax=Limisalsivibrio acetivorans TaxID=1304888 RepID=UPI0003B78044|nr:2-C-methyl-D-erythritol 4-phosphate cytidylyltransferase [Limisalsivibrio acetivorans]